MFFELLLLPDNYDRSSVFVTVTQASSADCYKNWSIFRLLWKTNNWEVDTFQHIGCSNHTLQPYSFINLCDYKNSLLVTKKEQSNLCTWYRENSAKNLACRNYMGQTTQLFKVSQETKSQTTKENTKQYSGDFWIMQSKANLDKLRYIKHIYVKD